MANNQQNEQEKKKKKKRLAIILPICLGLPVLAGAGVGIWWGVTHKAPIDEGIKLTKGAWVEQYNEDGPRVEELSGGSYWLVVNESDYSDPEFENNLENKGVYDVSIDEDWNGEKDVFKPEIQEYKGKNTLVIKTYTATKKVDIKFYVTLNKSAKDKTAGQKYEITGQVQINTQKK